MCPKKAGATRAEYCVAGRGHSTVPALRLRVAASFWQRAQGLLLLRCPGRHDGLWLRPCRAIHTVGMRRAIDVVFLDRHHRIVRVVHNMRPYRAAWCWRAYSVVELPALYCRRHKYYPAAIRRATRAVAVHESCAATAVGQDNCSSQKT